MLEPFHSSHLCSHFSSAKQTNNALTAAGMAKKKGSKQDPWKIVKQIPAYLKVLLPELPSHLMWDVDLMQFAITTPMLSVFYLCAARRPLHFHPTHHSAGNDDDAPKAYPQPAAGPHVMWDCPD